MNKSRPNSVATVTALLHKSEGRRDAPSPRRSYAMAISWGSESIGDIDEWINDQVTRIMNI